MSLDSPRFNNRLRSRLASAARQECDAILKSLKKQYPQLKQATYRFEDLPDAKMACGGLPAESMSTYIEPEIILFLFNIYQAHTEAADFRAKVQRVLLAEIGDLVGEDITVED